MFEHDGCWVYKAAAPTCPHCKWQFTDDEMQASELDLYKFATDEDTAELKCPSCDQMFWLRGDYTPHYHSAAKEEDL